MIDLTCTLVGTESVLFEWAEAGDDPAFRDVLALVKFLAEVKRAAKMRWATGRCRRVARRAAAAIALAFLGACAASTMTVSLSRDAVVQLAPSGTLRAAINFGNPVLAGKDATTGEPRGVSVDLARELAKRLGVGLGLVTFSAAGKVVEGIGSWDVAFLAVDPVRAADMDYTAPYVIIEGAYIVPQGSPIQSNDEVDRAGVRVVVGAGSAYDLYLTRELKRARIVRAPTSPMVIDTMLAQSLDVAAGVKQQMEADSRRVADVRVLGGRFMVINQAMATSKGRPAGARYLSRFVEEMKASGFVARALARHGIEGAAVAAAAP